MRNYRPSETDEFIRLEGDKYQKLIWGKPSRLFAQDEKKWKEFL